MAKKKKQNVSLGVKLLGERDLIIGVSLIILGAILLTATYANSVTRIVSIMMMIIGVMLSGFGINNFFQ